MRVGQMSDNELFAYRHSLAQGNSPAYWTDEADQELARRGWEYIHEGWETSENGPGYMDARIVALGSE